MLTRAGGGDKKLNPRVRAGKPDSADPIGQVRDQLATDITITVPAARLTVSATLAKVRRSDWMAARRKREERRRDAMARKQVKAEPKYQRLCGALREFAGVSEIDPQTELGKAIKAIRTTPGWERDEELLAAICTAILDEWSARWALDE
ncbi:hypothetical protein [Bradyrhizobium diazoefficiens]